MTWTLFWLLVKASGLTIALSAISIAIGFVLAVGLCASVLFGGAFTKNAARFFIRFIRGTPLLVQLLLIYHLLPFIGLDVSSITAAIVGMSLSTAAYQAEILRGGFASVPKGLIEAASMCGMSTRQSFLRIRVPIAFRLTLPSLANEATMILKASSRVSVVGVIELTRMAQDLAASTFLPLQLYTAAGALYLVINLAIAAFARRTEMRMNWGLR